MAAAVAAQWEAVAEFVPPKLRNDVALQLQLASGVPRASKALEQKHVECS